MNRSAPQGSILGTCFPVGDIDVRDCERLLKGVLEAFLVPTNSLTVRLPYSTGALAN